MSLVTWGIQEYTIYYFDKLKKEVGTVIEHFALKDQENIFLLKRKCKYNQQYTSSMLNLNKHNGNQFYDLSRVFLHRPFTLSARCPEVENIYLSCIIIYYTMKRAFPEHKNEFHMFDRDPCSLYPPTSLICQMPNRGLIQF